MRFETLDLGLIDYRDAWDKQKQVFTAIKHNKQEAVLILCSHNPVITIGRSGSRTNILAQPDDLNIKGIRVFEVERGGDVTYHGPGQLTAYPVFDLALLKKDIHWFLRQLEQVILDLLSEFGIEGARKPGLTGAWIGSKKVASIGIAIKNWITFHGLNINIKKSDTANFKLLRPCGMDIEMVSLEEALGNDLNIDEVKRELIAKFNLIFGG